MSPSSKPALTTTSDRQFAWFFGCLCLGFLGWQLWSQHLPNWRIGVLGISLLFLGSFFPIVVRPLNWLWFCLGRVLHHLTNPVIMGFLFFGVITPMAVLRRWFKIPGIPTDFDAQAKTYWQLRMPPGPDPNQLPYQY